MKFHIMCISAENCRFVMVGVLPGKSVTRTGHVKVFWTSWTVFCAKPQVCGQKNVKSGMEYSNTFSIWERKRGSQHCRCFWSFLESFLQNVVFLISWCAFCPVFNVVVNIIFFHQLENKSKINDSIWINLYCVFLGLRATGNENLANSRTSAAVTLLRLIREKCVTKKKNKTKKEKQNKKKKKKKQTNKTNKRKSEKRLAPNANKGNLVVLLRTKKQRRNVPTFLSSTKAPEKKFRAERDIVHGESNDSVWAGTCAKVKRSQQNKRGSKWELTTTQNQNRTRPDLFGNLRPS